MDHNTYFEITETEEISVDAVKSEIGIFLEHNDVDDLVEIQLIELRDNLQLY